MSIPGSKRTVLITGPANFTLAVRIHIHQPSSAIYKKLAFIDSPPGLHVFATARSKDAIKDLDAIGIETVALDVTSEDDIQAAKEHVEQRTGGTLDFLVNNAGRNYTVPALDVSLIEARFTFDTNFFAVVALTQAFTPLLITAASKSTTTPAPAIINIGSVAAKMPYVFGSIYNASKAALHSYSETLAVELAPFGVDVVVIVTGGVKSNIARTHRELPEGSYYRAVEAKYVKRQTHSQAVGMANEEYARTVVDEVLRKRSWWWNGGWKKGPRWIWKGASAGMVKWLTGLGLSWIVAEKFYRDFGLQELKGWWVMETKKER